MVNESKVKLMTRMAKYEKDHGQEDLEISAYYRKDYTSYHTVTTIIWITAGYVVLLALGAFAFMDELMAHFSVAFLVTLFLVILTGYIVLVTAYGIAASRFYLKKHNRARQRVKKFNHDLARLNRLYEKEKQS